MVKKQVSSISYATMAQNKKNTFNYKNKGTTIYYKNTN